MSNVVIQKPAAKGCENRAPVFVQAHTDMVCEKTSENRHDFGKDGIEIIRDGDIVRANGTSLGADNGIGMAILLRLLEDTFEHPPITAIFTSDEERGLAGVKNLDLSPFDGMTLVNLDAEEEGIFIASCAGGVRVPVRLPITREPYKKSPDTRELQISVCGLKGGHSGLEIDKERANAVLLLERVLRAASRLCEIFLLDISGGGKENSIPANARAVIGFERARENELKELIAQKAGEITAEYAASDPGIRIEPLPAVGEYSGRVSRTSFDKLLSLLALLPNGLLKKDVESGAALASANLGVVKLEDDAVLVSSLIRSNIDSAKYHIAGQFAALADLLGAAAELKNDYPAWEYNPDSNIREICCRVFEDEFERKPRVRSIHGGLECAYFAQKRAGLDMISLGCDIRGVHSIDERFSVSSAGRTYWFLKKVLERLR
ncbi:MAG: aminoacyl-histidine dipeptidase [Treponemataceae bacterium]|nr:MAG: aminoacyl-histidine dipeptidase [Treponemataceae bacterium]